MGDAAITEAQAAAEAHVLHEAGLTRTPVAPSSERLPGLTIDDAYDIQAQGIALRIAEGARPVGRKVGLTSAAMQEMLGVDQPDAGVVLDDMIIVASDGLDASTLIAPRAEAEIAFVLGTALSGADVTADDVLGATSHVAAALEIIDSRVADWRIGITDTIADNASSALVILGDSVPAIGIDLVSETATVTIGDACVSGPGSAVLGHPAEGVAWLVRTLAARGEGLEEGDIVIPGAVAAALPFTAGNTIRATFSTLGTLEVVVR